MYYNINELIEKYLKIVNSQKNKENKKYWDNADERYLVERWRGRSNRMINVPYTMAMDIAGYSKVLNINCIDYYTNPRAQLHEQLKYAIWEFENIDSNRYFENATFVSFGSVFEAAMFDAKINFLPNAAPWFDEKEHILEDKSKLLSFKPFDFYNSGLCGRAHNFYEESKKITSGYDIEVMFPITLRSPFSIAIMLRGFENLLMDFYDDPNFVHELLGTITTYLKDFAYQRAKFLNKPIDKCMLFNDEISTPMISNDIYVEFILPYEIELSNFCNGTRYWHSCGVTQNFYESVASIPGLKMMHIGPWSDIGKAVNVFGTKQIPIEICVSNNRDMYEKTSQQMEEHLLGIKSICDGKVKYSVRCDGIGVLFTIDECISKMNEWCKVAKQVFNPQQS